MQHLGHTDAAQLQRRSTDAVMIPANFLTTHFGIHRRQISSTLLCLLTQQVGMASKSTKAAENVYAPLVMVSLGARLRTLAGNAVYPCGSIDTNFDPP